MLIIRGSIDRDLPGFEAPYLIPEEVAGAWMVQELKPGRIGRLRLTPLAASCYNFRVIVTNR